MSINISNITSIDSDLLQVMSEVYDCRSASLAAQNLGITQSAVSHSLNRLRTIFSDSLFIRTPRGLRPTPRCEDLIPKTRSLLSGMEELLRERPRFDPATQQHTFRIATTDYFEQTVLPLFFQHLEKSAPQITVVSRPTRGELPRKELETGEFDLAIAGFYKDIPESFYQQRLFRDDFVGVTRKNLLKRKELTIAKYASLSHLVVSPQGDLKTMASQQMKKHGYDLQYRAGVSNFLSPARMLIHTDMILTCPRKLALSFIEMGHHDLLELPIEIPSISVIQVWHERNKSSEAHIWLRNAMKSVCDSLTGR